MSITGEPGRPPVKIGVPICDLVSGLYAALAATSAIRAREATGEGQHVDVSLFEAGVSFAIWEAGRYFGAGQVGGPLGSAHQSTAPYQAFETADGWITIGAVTPKTWAGLCEVLDLPALLADERYADAYERQSLRSELCPVIERATANWPTADLVAALETAGVPCAPISDYAEVFGDDHLEARQFFWDAPHPEAGRRHPDRLADAAVGLSGRTPDSRAHPRRRHARCSAGIGTVGRRDRRPRRVGRGHLRRGRRPDDRGHRTRGEVGAGGPGRAQADGRPHRHGGAGRFAAGRPGGRGPVGHVQPARAPQCHDLVDVRRPRRGLPAGRRRPGDPGTGTARRGRRGVRRRHRHRAVRGVHRRDGRYRVRAADDGASRPARAGRRPDGRRRPRLLRRSRAGARGDVRPAGRHADGPVRRTHRADARQLSVRETVALLVDHFGPGRTLDLLLRARFMSAGGGARGRDSSASSATRAISTRWRASSSTGSSGTPRCPCGRRRRRSAGCAARRGLAGCPTTPISSTGSTTARTSGPAYGRSSPRNAPTWTGR